MKLTDISNFLCGTLRRRLILGVAAINAIIMLLIVMDLTARQRAMLLERQVSDTKAHSQSLSTSAAGWIAADDISGLQELVEAQRRYPELIFAMITDERGQILAHTDRSRQGLFLSDLPKEPHLAVISRTVGLVDIASPALLGNRHVGWARVGTNLKEAGAKLAEITFSGILYALIAIIAASAIAWVMGRGITRRLYAVQTTISAVRAGNSLARCHLKGSDEAAQMAGEFNEMLDTLAMRDESLNKTHERFKIVMDSLDALVYVADMTTYEILFLNRSGREIWGDAVGKICWQTLQSGMSGPCPFCTNSHLILPSGEPAAPLVWEFRNTANNHWYECRDQAIRWSEGQLVRMEIASDITGRKQAEEELKKYRDNLEELVKERTESLEQKSAEIERINKVFIGRELRMAELKKEIALLKKEIITEEKTKIDRQ